MAETTEDCSPRRLFKPGRGFTVPGPYSPAVSTDAELLFISIPIFPLKYLSNQASYDKQVGLDSTSTVEAIDNDAAVEVSSTAGVQFLAYDSFENQHELPPAYSFPTDGSYLLLRPNQFKHRAETTNSVHSRQHHNNSFASKPTANLRPWINSRLRYGLKPEFKS